MLFLLSLLLSIAVSTQACILTAANLSTSPFYLPPGPCDLIENITGSNWTLIGTGSVVTCRGMVTIRVATLYVEGVTFQHCLNRAIRGDQVLLNRSSFFNCSVDQSNTMCGSDDILSSTFL